MRAPAILPAGYEVNPMRTQEQYAPPEDILSDVLTALCHAVGRAIELIPPDRPEYRRQACTYRLPEAERTITDREVRRDFEPTLIDVRWAPHRPRQKKRAAQACSLRAMN